MNRNRLSIFVAAACPLATAIADKFAKSDYRMSVLGNEFSNLINSLVAPESEILRFQTTGSHTIEANKLSRLPILS